MRRSAVDGAVDAKIACCTCRTVVLANLSNVKRTCCIGLLVLGPTNSIDVLMSASCAMLRSGPCCAVTGRSPAVLVDEAHNLMGGTAVRRIPGSGSLLCRTVCAEAHRVTVKSLVVDVER